MTALFTVSLSCRCLTLVACLVTSVGCRRTSDLPTSKAVAIDAGISNPIVAVTATDQATGKSATLAKAKNPEPLKRCFSEDSALSPQRSIEALLDRAASRIERASEQAHVCVDKSGTDDPSRPYREALACTEEALRQNEQSVEAHHNRALALLGLDRKDEAQRALTHAIALDPDDAETLAAVGELYIHYLPPSTENTQIGLAYVRHGKAVLRRVQNQPKRRVALGGHGTAAKRSQTNGLGPSAASKVTRPERPDRTPRPGVATSRQSLLGRLLLLEGQALSDLGRAGQALSVLDEAIVLTDSDQARYERGLVLFDLCRLKDAQATFSELTRRTPDDAWSHHQLGLTLEMLGDGLGAEKEFSAARKIAPTEFVSPLPVSPNQFQTLVAQEVAALSSAERDDLRKVRLELADLPALEDLTADQPTLSPTIVGLYRGLPVGMPESEPRSIVLYRKNLLRIVSTHEELRAQIRTTLLHELGHFRGEDDDELRDRGLE